MSVPRGFFEDDKGGRKNVWWIVRISPNKMEGVCVGLNIII